MATKSEEKFQITCFQLKITSFFEIVLSCKHFVQLIINKKASRCLQDLADRAKSVIVRVRTEHWSLSLNEKFIFVWHSELHFPKYKSDATVKLKRWCSWDERCQNVWNCSMKFLPLIKIGHFVEHSIISISFFFRKIWSWRIKSFYLEGMICSS